LSKNSRQIIKPISASSGGIFAETMLDRLFDREAMADAEHAVAHVVVAELPAVAPRAGETFQRLVVLREAQCSAVQEWLLHAGSWRSCVPEKARACARAIASAADAATYERALQNARPGSMLAHRHADLPDELRRATEAEEKYEARRRG
jgi:hypothetical protein